MSQITSHTVNRRQFVQSAGAGVLGTSLGGAGLTLPAQAAASKPRANAKADQMIVIWLPGGPPHTDMFDLKVNASTEYRGDIKPIQTSVTGFQVGELMPRLAQVADKYTVIRSCSIGVRNWQHGGVIYWLTGNPRRPSGTPFYPSYGQVISKLRPASGDLPSYVTVGRHGLVRGSYLGPAHDPLCVGAGGGGDVGKMLQPPDNLKKFDQDRQLAEALNKNFLHKTSKENTIQGRDEFQQRAFDMLRSAKLRRALEVEREDPRTFDRYGVTRLPREFEWSRINVGKQVIAARRLIEAGVPYVETSILGWDWHVKDYYKVCRMGIPVFDMVLSSLIEDLDERGLLERTIVLALGEMGRTPTVTKKGGRDHWEYCQFVFAAGGGFNRGAVVGATDKIGGYALNHYKVESLGRTVYTLLGIDPDQELRDTDGRPLKIIVEDAPLIKEAIA